MASGAHAAPTGAPILRMPSLNIDPLENVELGQAIDGHREFPALMR